MPLPSPKGQQDKESFISSCMGSDSMKEEYPDSKQRAAVCYSKWREAKSTIEIDFSNEIHSHFCCDKCKEEVFKNGDVELRNRKI